MPKLHILRLHDAPVKPLWQMQSPLRRSQTPAFEHSTSWCATSSALGRSNHALPFGHSPAPSFAAASQRLHQSDPTQNMDQAAFEALTLVAISAREPFVADAVVRWGSAARSFPTAGDLAGTSMHCCPHEPAVAALPDLPQSVAREVVRVAVADAACSIALPSTRARHRLLRALHHRRERQSRRCGRVVRQLRSVSDHVREAVQAVAYSISDSSITSAT